MSEEQLAAERAKAHGLAPTPTLPRVAGEGAGH
jgi:hypothetical protein